MTIHRIDSGPAGARLEFLERGAPGRDELEAFIHDCYAHAYGADLRRFMPLLIGLRGADGRPLAVMGVRTAAEEELLLEHYLDAPVEFCLTAAAGRPVAREGVVELGNLAVAHPGAARWMIIALNAYLRGAGFSWVALTAVPALRNAFNRLRLPLVELAPARGERLGEAQAEWGSYYETRPVVVGGDVAEGFARLERALQLEQAHLLLRGLWEHALATGRGQAR